jgi:hypothetical protein
MDWDVGTELAIAADRSLRRGTGRADAAIVAEEVARRCWLYCGVGEAAEDGRASNLRWPRRKRSSGLVLAAR